MHSLTLFPLPLLAFALFTACATTASNADASPEGAIAAVLDDWHQAASVHDGARYFGHMTPEAVFLGTDASERWTLAEFRAFCEPYFAKGIGWTYVPSARHVVVRGATAWVDEKLTNEKYGTCRGTAVLEERAGVWRIAHYSLTFLVPNERSNAVVNAIRGG